MKKPSYPKMNKINELSTELIKELQLYRHSLMSEIEYGARDVAGMIRHEEMSRLGESDPAAVDVDDEIREALDEIENEYNELFETIKQSIELLKKLESDN